MESKSANVAVIVVLVAIFGVAALGVVSAVAVYGVRKYITTAKDSEARTQLLTWSDGLARCGAARASLPPSSAAVPASLTDIAAKKFASQPSDWAEPAFACAGFALSAPQYHQYQWVHVTEHAGVARAIGDYDGDGSPDSILEIEVVCTGGTCMRGATITATHPSSGATASVAPATAAATSSGTKTETRHLVIGGLIVLLTLVGMAVGVWQLIVAFRVSLGWGLLVMFVPCGSLVFVLKHWELAKKSFFAQLAVVGACAVVIVATVALEAIAAPSATTAALPATASTAAIAAPAVTELQPPPVPTPVLKGAPAELNTVLGRARALADDWQREAALLGIEATGVVGGQIQTENGGAATITFGPSPFDTTAARTGYFVVTYDKAGLRASQAKAVAGVSKDALPEPMCAPENVYASATGDKNAVITLRYAFDSAKRPAWLITTGSAAANAPRAFDSQTCAPLQPLRR